MFNRLKTFFTDCADAIREKREITDKMKPDIMANAINSITSEPPTASGEFYHVIENKSTSNATIAGITYYGKLLETSLPDSSGIKEVVFYDDITSVPSSFFANNTLIEKVKFNGRITSLPTSLFANSSVREIIWQNGEPNVIPSTIRSITSSVFDGCSNLTNITWHNNITTIGSSAFRLSTIGLTIANTELPTSLRTIAGNAFYNQQIPISKIPANITNVASNAFTNNLALKTITFEGTPSNIYSTSFSGCNNLTTINVPWAEGAVANAPWGAVNATINYNYTGE